ncbi:hypothetical protein C922_01311 [Plasmodium inui San Antonio 1]|uniref:Uncharacterized protein n=1 Tax=Plasmodium inui San Antonio 1 TaxID=1237626 RepID=W7AS29_9APIC|nr:hypothetical protein C922_01311 [Plasmodium inui San Antonio 1]EUD68291.1 hypothetical protein C922_01311 [Plasmodium inui San Antonio 1]
MNTLPIPLIRNLIPSVTLNRINATHLLKHLENVCEHIALVGRYSKGKSTRRRQMSGQLKKVKRNRGEGISTSGTLGRSKLFDQVDEQFDKAVVLLPEFGPSGIIRLLHALQRIKYERRKRKKNNFLKSIEYYLLRGSVNDRVYDFWSHLKINDTILLFRMFIKNDYFEPALICRLMGHVLHNSDFCLSSDVVLFLRSYHIYRCRIKRIRKWRWKEVSLSDDCQRKLLHIIIRNKFDLTHKEMCTFVCLFSIYGRVFPFPERWEIYSKSIERIENTQLAYSPREIKKFILSLFRINCFLFDGACVPRNDGSKMGVPQVGKAPPVGKDSHLEKLPLVNPTLRKLFHLYNNHNTDVRVEDELRVLESAVRSHYYHYDSLEMILFHIKNNIAQLGLSNGVKFVRLVRKLRNGHSADGVAHTDACASDTEKEFVRHMLDQILTNCAAFFRARYKYPPQKIRSVLSLHRLAAVAGEPHHELTILHR